MGTGPGDVQAQPGAGPELDPDLLERLLAAHGISASFIDFAGSLVQTPLQNRLQVLRCLGRAPASQEELQLALAALEREQWQSPLPPYLLPHPGQAFDAGLRAPARALQAALRWELQLEQGGVLQGSVAAATLPGGERRDMDGTEYCHLQLELPALPPGYHVLRVQLGLQWAESLVIAAPERTWQPAAIAAGGQRLWGLSAQLYTLRSPVDWGMGDFADLYELCGLAAAQGAAFILLNPLHCPDLRYPDNASPYSPDDRRFLNPLYLHLPWCEGYAAATVQAFIASPAVQTALAQARATALVDYAGVHRLKLQALALVYEAFRSEAAPTAAWTEFQAFVAAGGSVLGSFAVFQAARWQQSAATPAVLAEPAFHHWLQWQCRRQLQRCQQGAVDSGMAIGLVQDLAVGSIVDGCEVQTSPQLFCTGARIGAPPDYFNPEGQNWGLPPLRPDALRATAGRHLRELLAASMSGCGALRIDHVMSLMRLWWCPDDGSNAAGAYVYYPVDLLFAILRLESQRHRCAVIGEDLGVVPPEIRRYLDDAGIFSNSVFYFEKRDGWHYRAPEDYKPQALAMMANHDVPPLACWWHEDDLAIRLRIGLIPPQREEDERNWRRGEKGQILVWLQEQGLLPPGWDPAQTTRALDADLCEALARGFGRVASVLVSVQLDDLAGADQPINIPGTHTEHANWRRKLPLGTAAIFASNIALRMMRALREARGAPAT